MNISISLAQMNVRVGDVPSNLAIATEMITEGARRGSDLVVLPELWSTGYDLKNASAHATAVDAGIFAHLAELARQHQIAISGSMLATLPQAGVGNTAVYIDRSGRMLGSYSKVHLFGPMAERRYLTEGEHQTWIDTGWARAGLAICYDLRFPEIFRTYAVNGAEAVILCAEWPQPRLEHWRILLRARAIENQMLVIACNRTGTSGNTEFFGRSTILDACGETILEGGEQEDLLTATIDTDNVQQVRASMPVFADRRPAVYNTASG